MGRISSNLSKYNRGKKIIGLIEEEMRIEHEVKLAILYMKKKIKVTKF